MCSKLSMSDDVNLECVAWPPGAVWDTDPPGSPAPDTTPHVHVNTSHILTDILDIRSGQDMYHSMLCHMHQLRQEQDKKNTTYHLNTNSFSST